MLSIVKPSYRANTHIRSNILLSHTGDRVRGGCSQDLSLPFFHPYNTGWGVTSHLTGKGDWIAQVNLHIRSFCSDCWCIYNKTCIIKLRLFYIINHHESIAHSVVVFSANKALEWLPAILHRFFSFKIRSTTLRPSHTTKIFTKIFLKKSL